VGIIHLGLGLNAYVSLVLGFGLDFGLVITLGMDLGLGLGIKTMVIQGENNNA